jgi:predicted AlkP superfamily pyrophosphatase or phosphodiesterase
MHRMAHSAFPTTLTLPDYAGGSIVNLIASIAAALGVEAWPYAPLRLLEPAPLNGRANILLLVVDGLGYRYLRQAHPSGVLHRCLAGSMTSVFPSTTATAITALMSGLAPRQHGLTGWHVYFEEIGAIGAVLPFRLRPTDEPLVRRGLQPAAVFDYGSFFDRVKAQTCVISPASIIDTEFNTAHSGHAQRRAYVSLDQFFHSIERALRAPAERKFVYAYYPELDSTAHEHGIGSRRCAEVLRRFDTGLSRLLTALSGADVTVLVTADHGFIDAPASERVELDDHPHLAATLAQPLCGERRAAYCYVRPGQARTFEDYVRNELADRALLFESGALIQAGWFGPGEAHPKLRSRVGDYTLLMQGRATIKDWMPGERRHAMIGVHGGASAEEMLVPLVVIEP